MSKETILKAIILASQTLPFLTITATFIGLAYTYGHSLTPLHMDDSYDLLRLSCHYLP